MDFVFLRKDVEKIRVLEIGCGHGLFRSNIGNSINEYWGVELNGTAANEAKKNLDKVFVGDFFEVCDELPNFYFDIVICADVIEHIADTQKFLGLVKSKMAPAGELVGSIPNVRYVDNLIRLLFFKDWMYTESGILDSTHLRFFTRKSILRMFSENGFKVIKIKGINPVSVVFPSLKSSCFSFFRMIFCLLVGRDSRFLQFGFRASQL